MPRETVTAFRGIFNKQTGICSCRGKKQPFAESSQGFDFGRQAAFMACRFVFMVNAFIGNTVDYFYRLLEYCLGGGFVARLDSFQNFLNRSAESSTLAGVVGTLFNRLAGTLAGLCAVGHIEYLLIKTKFNFVNVRF